MVDVERFRILLQEERDRKLALLPALRGDITSVSAARRDSNVDDEHDPEGATIAFELSQASALLEQSRAGLAQIDAAPRYSSTKSRLATASIEFGAGQSKPRRSEVARRSSTQLLPASAPEPSATRPAPARAAATRPASRSSIQK